MLRARMLILFVCALPALPAGQTPFVCQCNAPPEPLGRALAEAYNVPERVNGKPRTPSELLADRQARITPLMKQYPDNFWVLRTYIRCSNVNEVASDSVTEEFRKRYEARPGDPDAAYLYAHALLRKDSRKALDLFNGILQTTPDAPLVWYSLTQIYRSRVYRDQPLHDDYVRRYLKRCPDSDAGAAIALFAEDPGDIAAYVKDLRTRLQGKPQSEIAELHSILWKLEFRIMPVAQQEAIRLRIAEDLKFLATLDPDRYNMLEQVLREGYQLTGNQEALAKLNQDAQAKMQTADPRAAALARYYADQQAWSKANPYPGVADAAKRKAWTESRLQFVDKWIAALPDQQFLGVERLRLLDSLPAPDSVMLAEGERLLDAARGRTGPGMPAFGAQMQVASIWAKRAIALDRVPGLVDEALAAAAAAKVQMPSPRTDMYPFPDQRLMQENMAFDVNTTAWQTLTTAYLKQGNTAQARTVVAKWDAALNQRRKLSEKYRQTTASSQGPVHDSTKFVFDSMLRSLPLNESQYFQAAALLAIAENRKMDALVSYQAALRALSGLPAAAELSSSEAARSGGALWAELGGTAQGWQAWLDSLKFDGGGWSAKNRPLPDFQLKDVGGRVWDLTFMRGKVTLLSVWATWCGPCRAELPLIQKLYDQVKDRGDVQVVTLNVDENVGLLPPFLAEQKFTFPVLHARYFVDNFAGFLPIPTNWIVDPAGRLKFELQGFFGTGDEWIRQTLAQMERARTQAVQ